MATMTYTINSVDLTNAGSEAAIKTNFVNDVTKKLKLAPGNALIDLTIVNPELAYTQSSAIQEIKWN